MAAPFYNPKAELIDLGEEAGGWTLTDALAGSLTAGAIGGGKSSGPGNLQRAALLRSTADLPGGCGGIVFFAKNGEADEWEQACARLGRAQDVVRIRAGGRYGFNFMDWIARWGEGGERGPIPTVALLEEIGSVLAPQGGGQNAFWETALRIKLTNLVSLCQLANLRVSLAAMEAIASSSPRSLAEARSPQWRKESACFQALLEAEALARGNPAAHADFAAVRRYFLHAYATLDERPRSTIDIMFSQQTTPMLSRPLRPLLCEETNIWPEMTFEGKIFLVDLPVQEYGLTAKLAALAFKRCFQLAVMRRSGPPGSLRPVFWFADEAQNFLSPRDTEYQAVARSAGGITVLLTQQISSIREALGSPDKAANLTANLQTKWFCQNTGETNEWASKMIGERYVNITSINTGGGTHEGDTGLGGQNRNTGASIAPQKRRFIEEAEFQKLRRGGAANKFIVDCVFFCGGKLFPARDARGRPTGEMVPLKHLSFDQKG